MCTAADICELAEQDLNHPEKRKRAIYAAFGSRDTRFDGQVFVGVSSTGIYCRTVCTAHMPKYENCTFFHTAAEAETAGFRPCMTCRPELAPGLSNVDARSSLARRAAALLREECASGAGLETLAARLGYTDRHVRRAFTDEYGVTPVQYVQTCKLHLAKSLLTDTDLPVARVAEAAGFGSVRRFNHVFKEQYRLTPTALRKSRRGHAQDNGQMGGVTVRLGYRPPYRFADLLAFFRDRALEGVEVVDERSYARTVRIAEAGGERQPGIGAMGGKRPGDRAGGSAETRIASLVACTPDEDSPRNERAMAPACSSANASASAQDAFATGWFRVQDDPRRSCLVVTVSESLLPRLPQIVARVRRQFDVDCDPAAVTAGLATLDDAVPGALRQGMRLPGCFDPFETACRAILGQQVTVKAANRLAARIVERYGTPVDTGIPGLTHAFPRPEEMLALDYPAGPVEPGSLGAPGKPAGPEILDSRNGLNEPAGSSEPDELDNSTNVGTPSSVGAHNHSTPGTGSPFGVTARRGASQDASPVAAPRSLEDALGQLGVIKSRSRTIRALARLLASGELDLGPGAIVSEQMERLLSVKGIGPWSANYIAMRTMSYPDAFLETDSGVAHALPDLAPKQRIALADQWRPWRSYAVVSMWNSLGG